MKPKGAPVSKLAERDFLTGFYLRESFDAYLKQLLMESGVRKRKFSVVLLDLDHFKKFNDKFGHFSDEDLQFVIIHQSATPALHRYRLNAW